MCTKNTVSERLTIYVINEQACPHLNPSCPSVNNYWYDTHTHTHMNTGVHLEHA